MPLRMHANVVTLRYKSREDAEQAVEKLKALARQLPDLPGFQSFTLVRMGERETINVVRFATEENAKQARENMIPQVQQVAGPHLASGPEPQTGEVLAQM